MPSSVPLWNRAVNFDSTSSEISAQLRNPTDIFSVLLLLGGDVVCRAIAQLAGPRVAPVAFSFGWVSYAITAVLTVIGEHRLMPLPDSPCKVINARSGYVRENQSWILGRIMRDFEVWMDGGKRNGPIRRRLHQIIEQRWTKICQEAEQQQPGASRAIPRPTKAGLCVSVFRAEDAHAEVGLDWLYYIGFMTALLQLAIAAIPLAMTHDWNVLLVVGAGIILSSGTASLPQWSREKWACKHKSGKTVILTRGNGSQHAIVIVGTGKGLDLESLATDPADRVGSSSLKTTLFLVALSVLWVMLLIVAAGIRHNTWFLLAAGGIGMGENILVAGSPRQPEAFGIPLTFDQVIGEVKVMDTLFAVEKTYTRVGLAMLETFFPGKLSPDEQARWDELRQLADIVDESAEQRHFVAR